MHLQCFVETCPMGLCNDDNPGCQDNCTKTSYGKYSSMRFVTGCALFFEKKLFNEIGFFDENIFLYFEENDFYERCLKKGKSIFLVNNSKIDHKGNSSAKEIYKDEISSFCS